jgi:bis(5'-nucleosidyl)-tetraphosphatase
MPKENSAGAIIFRIQNGQPLYLLLHYPSGHWEFARGHVEQGEDSLETAKREIQEETGISDLQIIPGFKGYTKFSFKRTWNLKPEEKKNAPWIFKIVTLYLAKTQIQDVKISDEHEGFAWLPYQEAIKKLPKDAKRVFKEANDFLLNNHDNLSTKSV